MAKGLQEFIQELEKANPEKVLRVNDYLEPAKHEISCYMKHLEDRGNNNVVVFENITTVQGKKSPFPLAFNLFATRSLCARAIGMSPQDDGMELSIRFGELEAMQGSTQTVSMADAPVMQNVMTGDAVDVTTLPAGRFHEKDIGDYFVMACVMKAKSGDFYDITPTKNLIHDPKHMSVSIHGHHHLSRINQEHWKMDEPTPVAVVLGHHPAFYLGSCALTPFGTNDYELVSNYIGEPLRLVESATLGKDFLVPADAEIIIEGFIHPHKEEYQNPFGEISGHYQPRGLFPQMEVTAICHRNNAIMEATFPAHLEHINLGGIPKEGSVYHAIKKVVPFIKAIHLPPFAMGRFVAFISLAKRDYRDVTVAGMIAAAELQNMKLAVIVDEDVDVFNESEVMWAVATQCRWDKDLTVIPKVQSFRSWLGDAVGIIDATHHEEISDYPERNKLPADVLKRIKEQYFNK